MVHQEATQAPQSAVDASARIQGYGRSDQRALRAEQAGECLAPRYGPGAAQEPVAAGLELGGRRGHVGDANSTYACGTGTSAGHSLVS